MKVKLKPLQLFSIILLIFGCTKEDDSPTREPSLPTLTTKEITNVSFTSAISGGDISSDGGSAITSRGVVWSTSSNPTIVLPTKTTDGNGLGSYTSNLSGLVENTTYYFRAYATNSVGTAYGDERSFKTISLSLPTLTTKEITNVLATSAVSGGNITSDGGAAITSRGVVWSTSSNPTIVLPTKTTDGNGLGSYTSNLSGLVENTTYYFRAYATNSVGTAYGDERSFKAISPFAALETVIQNKMTEYNMPGISIAIIRNERLVYLNSFGYADKESDELATNNSLWRIASISKPITVVAILKLVEEGKLTLDQKVFGTNGILGSDYGAVPVGSNKDLITIRHLIDHKSGWTNTPNDPMFLNVSLSQSEIITEVLTNRPLTYAPGATYYYSNFGYCVLGRVIEKITQKTYENYVKTSILNPMGVTEMKIGGNTLVQRYPNEVKYYQVELSPYSMNVTRMDSHGGWIASAKDMAKFIVRIDRLSYVPDILPPSILIQNAYFGYNSWAHFGSLPGTSAILSRLDDTYSFILMTNTRTNTILEDLNNTMKTQIQLITSWPTEDLFN